MTTQFLAQPALDVLSDSDGSITRGWVADGVYYARFNDGLSASLGLAHVARLRALLSRVETLKYFSDASALTHYDLSVRSALVTLIQEQREKFSSIVMLNWAGAVTPTTEAFLGAVGDRVKLVRDVGDFDRLLFQAAPFARQALGIKTWTKVARRDAARRD